MFTRITIILNEGDAGCRAEVPELGIGIGSPTLSDAFWALQTLIVDHCRTLLVRTDRGTPREQRKIAETVVRLADEKLREAPVEHPAILPLAGRQS